MKFISEELKIEIDELEMIISQLILDKKINGKLNQILGIFEIENEKNDFSNKQVLNILNNLIFEIHPKICQKIK